MKILREWLGGREELDLSTETDYRHFAVVVEDPYDVDRIILSLRDWPIVCNEDNPEWIERYSIIEDGPIWSEKENA